MSNEDKRKLLDEFLSKGQEMISILNKLSNNTTQLKNSTSKLMLDAFKHIHTGNP